MHPRESNSEVRGLEPHSSQRLVTVTSAYTIFATEERRLCLQPKTHIHASVSMVKVSAFVLAPPIGSSCQHAKLSANVPAISCARRGHTRNCISSPVFGLPTGLSPLRMSASDCRKRQIRTATPDPKSGVFPLHHVLDMCGPTRTGIEFSMEFPDFLMSTDRRASKRAEKKLSFDIWTPTVSGGGTAIQFTRQ